MAGQAVVAHVRLIWGLLAALAATAQTSADPERFRQAGVCSRCHVAQVLEWSTSGHQGAGVACQNCHGASAGHVANERNAVKPDRLPRGAAIAGLCQSCHAKGCPKTKRQDACESCHHAHALFNPSDSKAADAARAAEEGRLREFRSHLGQGEDFLKRQNWSSARAEFEAALRLYPAHPRAAARLELAKRRLHPDLPGFETIGGEFDAETGLPLKVRVVGMPIEMALIPGGDADLGDDNLPAARPAHTVSLAPFYLARTELTQRAWAMAARENPSTHRGDDLPVHNISWRDAQQWIAQLNGRIAGGGFRLPTEAEWESAARGPSPASSLADRAWFRENSALPVAAGELRELQGYAPHRVGTRAADARGMYDFAGNVWEWCSTLLRPYPYDARDGRESPDDGGLRVLRGGGFTDSAAYLTPVFRHGERPDRRVVFNGMRLARSVPRP
jgi:formylglycine-generating enzyme required for sulfatase activity